MNLPGARHARASRWWAVALAVGACTAPRPRPVGTTAATVVVGELPPGPAPTIDHLPIPELPLAWEPPVAIAGDPSALPRALQGASRIHVQLGVRLDGDLWRHRVRAALAGWGWQGDVAFLPPSGIAGVFADVAAARTVATDAAAADALALGEPWRTKMKEGATPGTLVLAIDDAPIEEASWRARSAIALGNCDAPIEALAIGQEQALGDLEPFLDHADRVLTRHFRAQLSATLPAIRDTLRPHATPRPRASFSDPKSWAEHECGHAAWQYTQPFARCLEGKAPCEVAPRLVLVGGLRIAAPSPSSFLPRECPDVLGLDVAARMADAARDAAKAAATRLDPQWVSLADRLGALTEIHAALEDVCAPRRRRFAAADIDDARTRLAALGRSLASSDPPRSGRWIHEPTTMHVPGLGAVR